MFPKNFCEEIYAKRGRHAVLPTRGREAKRSQNHKKFLTFALLRRNLVLLKCSSKISCEKKNAAKRSKNHKKFLTIALLRRNLVFFGCSSKFSCEKIFAKHRRHAPFHARGGEAKTGKKIIKSFLDSRPFVGTLFSPGVFLENFLRGNFCKAWAPHTVSRTGRGSENKLHSEKVSWIHGLSCEPCFRNLPSKKFFGTEIFAKHRRHAAFARQSGGPKIMQRSWIHGLSWEPSFRNVSSKIFFYTEIFAKHRRHAASARQRGGPKIMQRSWIHGLSWEPCFRNVSSKKFFDAKILRSIGATQRLQDKAGGQKSCKDQGFTAFLGNLASGTFRPRNFSIRKILRSRGATQRL